MSDTINTPWYALHDKPHPFRLARQVNVGAPVFCASLFPWDMDSLKTLWGGQLYDAENPDPEWKSMILNWSGMIALGGIDTVYIICGIGTKRKPLCIHIPQKNHVQGRDKDENIRSICWAFSTRDKFQPLLLFSCNRLLYIYNLKRMELVGNLSGHGKPITSITGHPSHPQIICTTSHDCTSRIYDLGLTHTEQPNNPPWMPHAAPSKAGAAHGLHTTESEGLGIGQCVAILVGGRSGGHQGAVFNAAFHPFLPLIATCGMDRFVKIWRLPVLEGGKIGREDKPLFSSSAIHDARVLSVTWVAQDILVSHSAPAIMYCNDASKSSETYTEAGTLQMWQWLSLDRFFPPNQKYQKVLRGCASDYQESSSFKIISQLSLPHPPSSLHCKVYLNDAHDMLMLFPLDDKIHMKHIWHLKARPSSPFPINEEEELVEATKLMQLETIQDEETFGEWQAGDGWELSIRKGKRAAGNKSDHIIQAIEMGVEGRLIVAVGEQTLWIWELKA